MNINSPIGIFDSGVGGLTVARELFSLLPSEDIIYFGDVGRTPYGGRSENIIKQFTRQDISFLMEKKVKLIICACNTSSAVAIEDVKDRFDVEIIGVIKPGATVAADKTKNGMIGVIGTRATINSDAYAKTIKRIDPKLNVISHPCPLFVPLVEENYLENEAAKIIAGNYLQVMKDAGIDTLVLGCTHYPLMKDIISQIMGDSVRLIDSGEETAKAAQHYLYSITAVKEFVEKSKGERKFYVSDVPHQFSGIASRFLGHNIDSIEQVDITKY